MINISFNVKNDKLELPGKLHSVSDFQDYFDYIIKKTLTENPLIIYINKIAKSITLEVKTGYYLKSLKIRLLRKKMGETKVLLAHSNIFKNNSQHE